MNENEDLFTAIGDGDIEAVRAALGAGASVDARDSDDSTPLHAAVVFCRPQIAKLLVDHGANALELDAAGDSLLHRAAGLWADEADDAAAGCLEALVGAGVDPRARGDHGSTALHRAAREHDLPLLRALLAAGVDVEARDADQRTPLQLARRPVTARLLLDAGARLEEAAGAPLPELRGPSAVQIVESWYGITVPSELRAFLDDKRYARYPRHKPRWLPTYRGTPRVLWIAGQAIYPAGESELSEVDAEVEAEMLAEAGAVVTRGDRMRKHVFSGLEVSNFTDGELAKYVPFALLSDRSGQALAVDVSGGSRCPVLMYEHESGSFYEVSDSIEAFLATLDPSDD